MFRSLMLSGLVLSLSALGMLAGRGITPETEVAEPVTQTTTVDASSNLRPKMTPTSLSQDSERWLPLTLTAEAPSNADDASERAKSNEVFEVVDSMPEGVTREEAVQLIRKEFPDAMGDVIEGWAESFEGLSRMEIEGILQQKKLLSSSLDSMLPSSLQTPAITKDTFVEAGFERALPEDESSERLNEICETPGYRKRRQLYFPGGVPANSTVLLTDFTPGPLMITGCGHHAAVNDNSGLVMFRLENQTATRFGAFEILSDRRIGMKLAGRELPLAGIAAVPEAAQKFQIDGTGTVMAGVDGGVATVLGRIECIRFNDTQAITTTDDVTFDYSAMTPADFDVISDSCVLPGKLELSNQSE